MDSKEKDKKIAGDYAASLVKSGMTLGLGTGSTASHMVRRLGERIAEEKLSIRGVCTSKETEALAREVGIPIIDLDDAPPLELYMDGADEIDPDGNIIKGGGGALLREKLVALHSVQRLIICDAKKLVRTLGLEFLLPIEIVRFGHISTISRIEQIPCKPILRKKGNDVFVTDEGHYIVDCVFPFGISNPREMEQKIKAIHGVVEVGLFIDLCDVIAYGDEGTLRRIQIPSGNPE